MADILTAQTPQEFIEAVRATFRAYVPESDSWAQPNFFSVNATIIGGLAWTAVNEARGAIDARLNPQTATGEYLDIIATTPPLNLTRMAPTRATGHVLATLTGLTSVPVGYRFEAEDGTVYTATAAAVVAGGRATVEVTSVEAGSAVNSANNRPLTAANGTAVSLGIYGGNDTESDEAFRRRIYAAQARPAFFGSACSYEQAILAVPGVTRAWAIADGLVAKVLFLMEDKYPCGAPWPDDIKAVQDYFADECLTGLYSCITFEGARTLAVTPTVTWDQVPDDLTEIEDAMRQWLRDSYDIGEGVRCCEIDQWLRDQYPDLGPRVTSCADYPATECAVYTCAEITNG